MGKFIDMTGWRMSEHGVPDSRIVVINQCGRDKMGAIMWLCRCLCGNDKLFIVSGRNIRRGGTKSCGCLQKEIAGQIRRKFKKFNKYDLSGEYGVGWTFNTNEEFYFDLEDYDKIKDICWHTNQAGTTKMLTGLDTVSHKTVRMHNVLGFFNYDHIDRNELNNQKSNLRPCTPQENARNRNKRSDNTSGIIGVYYDKDSGKWRASISLPNKKSINLKRHTNKEDAIRERLAAEAKYYGAFAPQIHLFEQYGISIHQQGEG